MSDDKHPDEPDERPSNLELDDRLKIVERLVKLFQFERLAYLASTVISVIILLVCVAIMLSRRENQNIGVLAGIFGSAGLITYSLSRLLRMWDQAIRILVGEMEPKP
ncbi:hypothetical protein QO010_002735 [Caulobacter ginsengisoli]|uniref:Uncharacterized protein n=1 Tax=Caulobacter ginsengisoli TaxID=400775 RepID=A0ABU0ISG3_9CAUL|nr:hypothetical protein [Caulobacter ginsengisoli]MDQ0464951.1 hypothetical protein [Caulobacter ginsengisoli]